MQFKLLGPVQACANGQPMALGGRKQRLILAVLLLECNQLVSIDRLVDLLWPEHPPGSARRTVQAHLSRLRTVLTGAGAATGVSLVRRGPGYLLTCCPELVDAHVFRQLLDRARCSKDAVDRSRLLHEALQLWRGPALADAATEDVREELCRGLDDARLAAIEERLDAELELGRGRQLVDELSGLVARHPYRQRFAGQLMRALYDAGRASDALDAYARIRHRLKGDLGMEPAEELKVLQITILRGDPPLRHRRRTAGTSPAQLPADVPHFVGREAELRSLGAALARTRPTAPSIAVVTGGPGVGKTALAVHWAQQNAGRFRDGQLYVNLQGHATDPPVAPEDALRSMLCALGTEPDRVPDRLPDMAGLYRSALAGQRILVVLDDARTADQVRPLLPGSGACGMLVTSRRRLDGLVALEGAEQIELPTLPSPEAEELLLAAGQLEPDPAVAALATWCGHLPLALRMVAAKLAAEHHRGIAAYVARIAGLDPLDELRFAGPDELSVVSAFDVSYAALPDPARRMFRVLGALPAGGCPAAAVVAFSGVPAASAHALLNNLVDAHLVERHADDRITVPPLLHRYAGRKLAEEEDPSTGRV
jgi:DNA-binding SARP family transcriptional activator